MEKFNSRDLMMTAGLLGSMLGETPFADQDMDESIYRDYEDLIIDAMDYAIEKRN